MDTSSFFPLPKEGKDFLTNPIPFFLFDYQGSLPFFSIIKGFNSLDVI